MFGSSAASEDDHDDATVFMRSVTDVADAQRAILTGSMSTFFRRLWNQLLLSSDSSSNIVFSSFSIFRVLALTFAGVGGDTQFEFARALSLTGWTSVDGIWQELHSQKKAIDSANLRIAEAVFLRQGLSLLPGFSRIATSYFQAECSETTFPNPGTDEINAYVKQKTRDMIPKIVELLDPLTAVVLINCVYFKADWLQKFLVTDTIQAHPFRTFDLVPGRRNHLVNMMSRTQARHLYASHTTELGVPVPFESCLLEYVGGKYGMLFLKPRNGHRRNVFDNFLKGVGKVPYLVRTVMRGQVRRNLEKLQIPKFSVEFSIELVPVLKELGIQQAFIEGDFSKMLQTTEPICISNVIHKAKMKVDEAGTVAAAATAVILRTKSSRPVKRQTYEFVLDSPFVCFIVEIPTSCPVFCAVIRRPETEEGVLEDIPL